MELSKSALRVMNVIWDHGDLAAKEISEILRETVGWNKNTTYTVIGQCVKKGLLQRRDPGFFCHALLSRQEAQRSELSALMDTVFLGSPGMLFSTLVKSNSLSREELEELQALIDELKK